MLSSLLENDTGYPLSNNVKSLSLLHFVVILLRCIAHFLRADIIYGSGITSETTGFVHLARPQNEKKVCLQPKHVHLRALSAYISTLATYSYVHELNTNIHNKYWQH